MIKKKLGRFFEHLHATLDSQLTFSRPQNFTPLRAPSVIYEKNVLYIHRGWVSCAFLFCRPAASAATCDRFGGGAPHKSTKCQATHCTLRMLSVLLQHTKRGAGGKGEAGRGGLKGKRGVGKGARGRVQGVRGGLEGGEVWRGRGELEGGGKAGRGEEGLKGGWFCDRARVSGPTFYIIRKKNKRFDIYFYIFYMYERSDIYIHEKTYIKTIIYLYKNGYIYTRRSRIYIYKTINISQGL